MAKVLFTAVVADMRNKLNGTVFSKNRYGSYTRTKVTPVNRRSSAQQKQRLQLGELSAGFRALKSEQIAAWNAAAGDFQRTDIFGNKKTLTGQALYVGLNTNLLNIGASVISDPPAPSEMPLFSILEITASWVDGVVDDASVRLNAPLGTDFKLLIYATPPRSAGRRFFSDFRLLSPGIPIPPAGAPAVNYDYGALYEQKFGLPANGTTIGFRLVAVNRKTGEASAPLEWFAIAQNVSE